MQNAQTLRKTNAPNSAEGYEGGLIFSNAEKQIANVFSECMGKILLISDLKGYRVFSQVTASPRAVCVIPEEDYLSLFTMPEVCAVIGAGGKDALLAARVYSELLRIPCTLIPMQATLTGAVEREAEIVICGQTLCLQLPLVKTVCDISLMEGTFADAYGRILLAQLEAFETFALNRLGLKQTECGEVLTAQTQEEIVRANAELSLHGEGQVLCSLLKEDGAAYPEWQAYSQLLSLYAAFCEKGKPRRYFTPDYRKRAQSVGKLPTNIPTTQEYAVRAIRFEQERAALIKAVSVLANSKEKQFQALCALDGGAQTAAGVNLNKLKYLPEYHAGGLTSVIRDFGLMEWELYAITGVNG